MIYEYEIHGYGNVEEEILIEKLTEAGLFDVLIERDIDINAFIDEQSDMAEDTLSEKWHEISKAEFIPKTGLAEMITKQFESVPVKSRKSLALAIHAACLEMDISMHTEGLLILKIFNQLNDD